MRNQHVHHLRQNSQAQQAIMLQNLTIHVEESRSLEAEFNGCHLFGLPYGLENIEKKQEESRRFM